MRIRKNNRPQIRQLLFPDLLPGERPSPYICKFNKSPWDIKTKGHNPFAYTVTLAPLKFPEPEPLSPPQDVSLKKGEGNSAGNPAVSVEKVVKKPEIVVIDDDDEDDEKMDDAEENVFEVEIIDGTKLQGYENFLSENNNNKRENYKIINNNVEKSNIVGLKYFRRNKKREVEKPAAENKEEEEEEEEEAVAAQPRRSRRIMMAGSISSKPNEFYYYSGFGPTWSRYMRSSTVEETNDNKEDGDDDGNFVEVPLVVLEDVDKKAGGAGSDELEINDKTEEALMAVDDDHDDANAGKGVQVCDHIAVENIEAAAAAAAAGGGCDVAGEDNIDDDDDESMDEDDYYWLYGVEKPLKVAKEQQANTREIV